MLGHAPSHRPTEGKRPIAVAGVCTSRMAISSEIPNPPIRTEWSTSGGRSAAVRVFDARPLMVVRLVACTAGLWGEAF